MKSSRLFSSAFVASLTLALLATLAGCAGSSSTGTTTTVTSNGLAAGGASNIYVVQQPNPGTQSILTFTVGANGASTPTNTLSPAGLYAIESVATDSSGQIYVGAVTTSYVGEILVFAAGATGAATPLRTIIQSGNSGLYPYSLAVDASGNIYGSNGSGVSVFSATANGTVVPTRFLTGSATQFYYNGDIAADAAGNIYVTNQIAAGSGSILIFAPGTTGNVAPARVITSTTSFFYGVAVDASGDVFAALDSPTAAVAGSIVEFGPTASGTATPIKSIGGTTSGFFYGGGLRVDAANNLYAVNLAPVGSSYAISLQAYPPSASGNVAPAVQFTSTAWSSPGSELAVH